MDTATQEGTMNGTTDRAKELFAVTPGNGNTPFLTTSRSEAVTLAHQTNGSWTKVPSTTVAADLLR